MILHHLLLFPFEGLHFSAYLVQLLLLENFVFNKLLKLGSLTEEIILLVPSSRIALRTFRA